MARQGKPEATDYPDDANGRVLAGMQKSGADMSATYAIDFEHVFPEVSAAERFVREAAMPGRRVGDVNEYDGASGYYWQVRVVVRMVPTYAAVTSVEHELGEVAKACGGRTDGWGVLA